jgi:hypothetical protein
VVLGAMDIDPTFVDRSRTRRTVDGIGDAMLAQPLGEIGMGLRETGFRVVGKIV